jgi:hypothetical protein
MFTSEAKAQEFLTLAKREYVRRKRTKIWDGETHLDAIRALELLVDVKGASLEKAAELLKRCASSKEKRGGDMKRQRTVGWN